MTKRPAMRPSLTLAAFLVAVALGIVGNIATGTVRPPDSWHWWTAAVWAVVGLLVIGSIVIMWIQANAERRGTDDDDPTYRLDRNWANEVALLDVTRSAPIRRTWPRNRRLIAIGAVMLVGVIALTACLYLGAVRPTAECVIAIDAQGSSEEMASTYQSWLPREITGCAKADLARVDVLLINGDTSTSLTMPVTMDLSKVADLTGDPVDDDKILTDQIDSFTRQVVNVIFHAPPSSNGTDLIATSCVASPMLIHHSKATLIIDSDGMNDRGPYVFGAIPLDEQHITAYLEQLQQTHQVCDLPGVTVEWYGAGVGTGTPSLPPGTLTQVHRFWTAYFKQSGTNLKVYQRSL